MVSSDEAEIVTRAEGVTIVVPGTLVDVVGTVEVISAGFAVGVATCGGCGGATGAGSFPVFPNWSGIDCRSTRPWYRLCCSGTAEVDCAMRIRVRSKYIVTVVKRDDEGSRHHGGSANLWDRLLDEVEELVKENLREEEVT
jgi:hypothetical protein